MLTAEPVECPQKVQTTGTVARREFQMKLIRKRDYRFLSPAQGATSGSVAIASWGHLRPVAYEQQ